MRWKGKALRVNEIDILLILRYHGRIDVEFKLFFAYFPWKKIPHVEEIRKSPPTS